MHKAVYATDHGSIFLGRVRHAPTTLRMTCGAGSAVVEVGCARGPRCSDSMIPGRQGSLAPALS